jgi:hypothetical protein
MRMLFASKGLPANTSASWPGYAGVLTATAPSRFTACINQAPMYRRNQHPWLRLYDLGANGSSYMG